MDYTFPGSIAMACVHWETKSEFQFIENHKLLPGGVHQAESSGEG